MGRKTHGSIRVQEGEPIISASETSLESLLSVPSVVSLQAMRIPFLLLGLLAALSLREPVRSADAPFVAPAAYCEAVGAADAPDARYTGPAVPDWMVPALYSKDEIKAQKKAKVDPARAVVWRCMQGKVWACVQGNSPTARRTGKWRRP